MINPNVLGMIQWTDLGKYVKVNERRLAGAPTVAESRFSVSQLLAELADGSTVNEIANEFEMPLEELKDVLHALALVFNHEDTRPSPSEGTKL
jgi:uncharacterized protein (DUF433 family)